MKKTSELFVVAALAFVAGCASAPKTGSSVQNTSDKAPDWIGGSSMEYPRERYLVGVGSADDRSTAEDRARGEISRIFSSKVSVKTASAASESTVQGQGAKDENSFSQSVANSVQTVSKKVLEGVEVPQSWQDNASRVWYVLAIMDKAKGVSAVTDKIKDFDAQIKQWKDQLSQATDKFPKAKAAMKIVALLKARKDLEGDLRILDGQPIVNPADEAAIKADAAKILSQLEIAVDISGASSREVETGIIQGLSGFGLQMAAKDSPTPADITIKAAVDIKPVESTDERWKFARSYATVSLKDGKSGKVFLQFDAVEKSASGDYNTAARRSLANLSKKIAQQVSDGITAYFENQ